MQCAVYILANKPYGTLYIGVTSNLIARVAQHNSGEGSVFTRKYKIDRLVWYETGDWYDGARQREKAMKHWRRDWKIDLINRSNPTWRDLYHDLY